jgi:hypothetical protein
MAAQTGALAWIDADGGYAVALVNGQIIARGPRGAVLKSVPAALRDSDVVQQLRELRDWLTRHERECLATVESWMVRSLPVPSRVLCAVWTDPAWQRPLRDAVVMAVDARGEPGFLRQADPEHGVGVVTLDGETVFSSAPVFAIPHPVNLPELAEYRDFATELQVEQGIAQLYRETWAKPADLPVEATEVGDFSGGRFAQLLHATGRCRTLGYQVSAGSAVTKIWEAGRQFEARYWIGGDAPEVEASTGDLTWVDSASAPVKVAQLGPLAYSEGMRMAASIYAGRVVEEDDRP